MQSSVFTTEYDEQIHCVFEDEKVLLKCEYDLSDKSYVNGVFVVTDKSIGVFENGRLRLALKLENINRVCRGEYIGCGVLEAFTCSGRQILVRFSMRFIERFNAVCEAINDLLAGNFDETFELNTDDEKVCPKCGGAFIRGTKICRHCTDKMGVVKRLWKLSDSCKPLYVFLVFVFLLNSVINILTPYLKRNLVNDVFTAENATLHNLLYLTGLMLLLGIGTYIINVLRDIASSKASNMLVKNLRADIYAKLQRLPLGYIEEKKAGDLMQRINNDTQRIQSFIQDIAIMAIGEAIMLVAIAIITFSMDAVMSLLIFIPIPPSVYLIYRIRYSIHRRYRKQWRVMDRLTSRLADVLNGINVVKVFGRENDETQRFKQTAENVRDLTCRNEKYVYTIFPIIKFIMSFGSYFVLLYGGSRVLGGELSLGELIQFSSYGSYLYGKLEWFSMVPRHLTMAVASSQRVFEVLDILEAPNKETIMAENVKGDFEFKNVSFGYKSYKKVLRNINNHIESGEMIGLVGHSGAGKSTVINLIMKLYGVGNGEIELDGTSLEKYDDASYKNALGVVLQENYLFSGSILDNIKYAAPDASEEECILAAKKACAHGFIVNLPDGYNTYVGEKGHRLSGGERQRVSIARAIAANPRVIILDEATASVDTETEMEIQKALQNVTDGKTVFAIAHRLSTLKNADRLLVLEEGRIVEEGTHKMLEEKNGIYSSLLKAQQDMVRSRVTIDNTIKKEM